MTDERVPAWAKWTIAIVGGLIGWILIGLLVWAGVEVWQEIF